MTRFRVRSTIVITTAVLFSLLRANDSDSSHFEPLSVIKACAQDPPAYSRSLRNDQHTLNFLAQNPQKDSGAVLLRADLPAFSRGGILVLRGGSPEDEEDEEMGGENELLTKLAAVPDSEDTLDEAHPGTVPKVSDPIFENILKSQPIYKAELQVDVGNLCVMDVDTNIAHSPENEQEGRVLLEVASARCPFAFAMLWLRQAVPFTRQHRKPSQGSLKT
eukprot:924297-Rhodomonas_salina.1